MSMTLGAYKNGGSEMNVTPLIDVLLVLLIIFMVLPPHHRGERAEIPQRNTAPSPLGPDELVVIRLLDAGSGRPPLVRINQEEVPADALEKRLTAVMRASRRRRFSRVIPKLTFSTPSKLWTQRAAPA